MRFATILLSLLLCSTFLTPAQAEITSLKVVFGERKFTVPAFEHDGVLYASLNELSKGAGLSTYENAESGKIEVRVGENRLKFTANNPFVVVLSHRENTISEVYQLPVEVSRTQVAYYLPMAPALPLLSRTWGMSLLLDQGKAELVITSTSKPVARVTGVPESGTSLAARSSKSGTNDGAAVPDAGASSSDTATPGAGAADLAPREIAVEKASTYDIGRISVDTRKNGTLIRIHTRKQVKSFDSELKNGSLVVTLSGASVDVNELRQTPTDGEGITGVEAEQLGGNARISFTLNGSFTSDKISRDVKSGDLLVSLFRKVDVGTVLNADKRGKQDGDRSKWKLDCIVIDAGHGGKDPGAIGVSGIKEKNVTLGIALKLGKMIEREMPGVKIVYTRKDDTFIPLDKRGQIANAAEGKLFISIHCNATEAKPSSAKGFEVYILRPGRTAEAIRIAEFENSVIKLEKDYEKRYAKLDNESFILINMAHSAYAKYSERFAELLHDEVKASRQVTSKGVKQAGFYVLVGASMPGVLIESGFVSNRNEEKFLASNEGQEHLAKLFFDAISSYAKEYEKSLKE
ncbi:MAG: N-acetylmuramoyl-L-alanine amidase [Bacteroidetes bacterium]|nr:N-acetylmuramoyl-L-alanine amidase [Bacteroidota bacterium]